MDKFATLIKTLDKMGLKAHSSIVKIAIDLIDQTDGSLSLADIIRIEEDGFGLVFTSTDYSLRSQIDSVMKNDYFITKEKIPEGSSFRVIFDSGKDKFIRKALKTPISKLTSGLGYSIVSRILESLTQEIGDDIPDKIAIFGSKEGYLLAGIDSDSAEIYDMSGDKSSPNYDWKTAKRIFEKFIIYCHENGVEEIEFSGRESTSAVLMDGMSKRHESRKKKIMEGRDIEHPSPFDKIKEIEKDSVPSFTLDTKFGEEAKSLSDSYNKISSKLKKPIEDNFEEDLMKKIDSLDKYFLNISSIIGQDSFSSKAKKKLLDEIERVGGSGFFSNIISSKKSKMKAFIEIFVEKIRDDIIKYLEKNKYDHFTDENYYEYSIKLNEENRL